MEHLQLVTAIAVRVQESLPVHTELDDLINAGIMGLFDAATKYKTDKQVAFSAYAKHRIKGAILDGLRQIDWASRDLRRRHKQMENVTRELATKLDREPTEPEVAREMGLTQRRWNAFMIDLRSIGLAAAQLKQEREDQATPDTPCAVEDHPDKMFARRQLRDRLSAAMQSLPTRYQQVVSMYYDREMTMKEIGGALGVNESRVSQIHKSALERMQSFFGSNGIQSASVF